MNSPLSSLFCLSAYPSATAWETSGTAHLTHNWVGVFSIRFDSNESRAYLKHSNQYLLTASRQRVPYVLLRPYAHTCCSVHTTYPVQAGCLARPPPLESLTEGL